MWTLFHGSKHILSVDNVRPTRATHMINGNDRSWPSWTRVEVSTCSRTGEAFSLLLCGAFRYVPCISLDVHLLCRPTNHLESYSLETSWLWAMVPSVQDVDDCRGTCNFHGELELQLLTKERKRRKLPFVPFACIVMFCAYCNFSLST